MKLIILIILIIYIGKYGIECGKFEPQCNKDVLMNNDNILNNTYPIWPKSWNSTLIKVDGNNKIQWNKFWYDEDKSKFEFWTNYLNLDCTTPKSFYTIYFYNTTIIFDYPIDKNCCVRSTSIPNISRWWLRSTKFVGNAMVRGIYSEIWQFPQPINLQYITSANDEQWPPVRSFNQKEDPGATDYVDVQLGKQDEEVFTLPSYECASTCDESDNLNFKQYSDILNMFGIFL